MHELNSTAIMIVRNPFAAIIGHRHLVSPENCKQLFSSNVVNI